MTALPDAPYQTEGTSDMNRTAFQLSLAAAAIFAAIGGAGAQTSDLHHTGAPAGTMPMAAQPGMSMPGAGEPAGAAMGGDMGRMMEMMGGMGMPFEHVEGRIAYLKAELKITEAQSASWNAFADTMRTDAAAMKALHDGMAGTGMPATAPDRMAAQRKMLAGRMAMMDRSEASMKALYAALSAEQRTSFDQIMPGPMGMM